jgi:hypothetical protein
MSKRCSFGAVACVLVSGLAGGAAYAKVSDAGGTINACYAPGGFLRLLGPNGGCRAGETAISWNQQGPAGPAGPTGRTGPAGPSASLATTAVWGETVQVPPHGAGEAVARCPSSTTAIATGFFLDSYETLAPPVVTSSQLVSSSYAEIDFRNPSDFAVGLVNAIVYCAPSS